MAGTALTASVLLDDWAPVEAAGRPVLAVPEGPYLEQAELEGLAAFEDQVSRLEAAGYRVLRRSALTDIDAINRRHLDLVAGEFFHAHRAWFD